MSFPFRKIPAGMLWCNDPLKGSAGLAWYERKPSSLTPEEWKELDRALAENKISALEYVYWKENVK